MWVTGKSENIGGGSCEHISIATKIRGLEPRPSRTTLFYKSSCHFVEI